jgi:microcystin-dependent protein
MIMKKFLERTGALSLLGATIVAALLWIAAPPPRQASAQFPSQATFAGTSGGAPNVQTLTLANMPTLVIGVPITFFPGFTNTGPTTVNINSIANTTTLRPSSLGLVGLSGGELQTGVLTTIVYDGTNFDIVAPVNPAPIGSTIDLRGTSSSAPPGYLIEDGSCISQTTYAALFSSIGTTYGGACGGGLFELPDSRGTIFAALDGQGVNGIAGRITTASCATPNAIGLCGTETKTLLLTQLPTGITSAGNVTVVSGGTNIISASVNNPSFNFAAGGGSILSALSTGAVSGQQTSTGSNTLTSNNTNGLAHAVLNPVLMGRRAIKY